MAVLSVMASLETGTLNRRPPEGLPRQKVRKIAYLIGRRSRRPPPGGSSPARPPTARGDAPSPPSPARPSPRLSPRSASSDRPGPGCRDGITAIRCDAPACVPLYAHTLLSPNAQSRKPANLCGASSECVPRWPADCVWTGRDAKSATATVGRRSSVFRRYAFVRQNDQSDCGAAALATIALHHRRPISLQQMRDLAGTDRIGTNLLGLVQAAEKLGYSARAVKGPYDPLPQVPLPAIAHTRTAEGLGHFVVVHKVSKSGVVIADPARGVQKLTRDAFCGRWTGYLLIMVPDAARP